MSSVMPPQSQTSKAEPPRSSTVGNLLLQRKCDCGSPTSSLTGECAECGSQKRLQTKLTVGASNDPLELEADRVADQVMAAPSHASVRSPLLSIQRFAGQATAGEGTAPASVHHVLASSGTPLEFALRQDMEQRFGHDFSRVRIHSGGAAEQSARDVNANAYTVGRDVVFGVGRYAPNTSDGRWLIAHELTHVVQQTSAGEIVEGDESRSVYPRSPDARRPRMVPSRMQSAIPFAGEAVDRTLRREEGDGLEAPDLEIVPETGPGNKALPKASVDPRGHSSFVDQRIGAVGLGLSGADFILFCDGVDAPIALPFGYIDLTSANAKPIDGVIYATRDDALAHVPYGPPDPNSPPGFAYYRAVGGLVVPTTFSAASAPETFRMMKAAQTKLRGLSKDVTDFLVTSVLLFAAASLLKMGISRWIVKRGNLSRQRLQEGLKDATVPAPILTIRPRATPQQLRDMIANSNEYYTWRTVDGDVAANQSVRFTGKTNPDAPEGVYLVRGVKGVPYGKYAVSIKGDRFHIRSVTGRSEEFILPDEIPANEGVWYTAEDYAAAGGTVGRPK
jgi:uncharacterized protein DUF4157